MHVMHRRAQSLLAEAVSRDKEVGALREQVAAELEAARQLAASAAADRASLAAREREVAAREQVVATRESDLTGWRERAQHDMARKHKVCNRRWCWQGHVKGHIMFLSPPTPLAPTPRHHQATTNACTYLHTIGCLCQEREQLLADWQCRLDQQESELAAAQSELIASQQRQVRWQRALPGTVIGWQS
jgi:hypothetical protein